VTRIHIILLALALFHSGAAPAAARESIAPQPNDRVRLSVSTSDLIRVLAGAPMTAKELRHEQFIGTLQGRRDDDIVIRVESPETELAVPVKSVVRIEASRGMQGCAGDGAAAGLGVGAVAGVLLGVVACSQGDCEGTPGEGRGDEKITIIALVGVLGAVVGAGIGAVVGSQMSCEHWETIRIKDLPYGEGLRQEDGIRLGFALPMPRH